MYEFFSRPGPCMYFFRGAGWLGAVYVFYFRGRGRVSIFISQFRPARAVLVFFLRFEIKIFNMVK